MESSVAIRSKEFVVIGTESSVCNSYLVLKRNHDKFSTIDNKVIMTYICNQGDGFRTAQYITEKIKFEQLQNELPLTPEVVSNVIQDKVHYSLRRNPLNHTFVVGGKDDEAYQLYTIDPYGAMYECKFTVVGIAGYFCYGILDNEYKDDISLEEAIEAVKKCYEVLKENCVINLENVDLRILDSSGIRDISISL
ncbi:PREDICTED: probable proteasome subunit beta type-4 [Polistes dominula]|uniref:Probable proteasome subunit beta type-4 n=1 Tax=Polistes dominula TaxID=743375 RepID=A0ABM1JAB4_POLDO|nr:PREDICTED: probable proteasome subunit beta type-4 [Polistes dominula]